MTARTLVFLVAVLASLAVAGATGAAEPVKPATIASSTAADFRVVVTATKGPGGEAPSTTVNIAAGPRSISQFSISANTPERTSLRLLVSPALGWSRVYHFHVAGERLVAG